MQSLGAVTTGDLLSAGQRPLMRLEVYYGAGNYIATMTFDSGSVEPRVDEVLSGERASGTVISVTLLTGTWAGGNAAGTISLGFCSDRFYENENIDGSVGGANMLTVNNPDTGLGVDGHAINGGMEINDDWIAYGTPISVLWSNEYSVRTGLRQFRVGCNGAGDGIQMDTDVYPTLVEGRSYRFSKWVLWRDTGVGPPDTVTFRLGVTGDGTATLDTTYGDVSIARATATSDWYEVYFTATCTKSGTVRLYLVHRAITPYFPPVFYVDDVTIYEDLSWINISSLGGKNYLKDISFSSGGARMSPNPMAAQFSAIISNEGSVFHPSHPTSTYRDYFQAGKRIRISIGGNYTVGGIKYWQRIIGVMDEPKFSVDKYELTIKGLDYTKTLSDIKFTKEIQGIYPGTGNTPIDNYWGSVHTVSTTATAVVLGGQLYNEADALDIAGDANNIANWAVVAGCVIAAVIDGVGAPPSVNQILITKDAPAGPILGNAENDSPPLAVVLGTKYRVSYYWRQVNQAGNPGNLKLGVYASGGAGALIAESAVVTDPGLPYTKTTFEFTSTITGNVKVMLTVQGGANSAVSFYVDDIDFQDLVLGANTPYLLPATSTGIYYVELDNQDGAGFQPVWPGKQKGEGWYYDITTRWFSFDEDKFIEAGTNNLHIWHFEAIAVENILADILVKAALYVNRAAALAAMGAPATGVNVDRAWFEGGSTYINSIKMLCERTNYRFSFKYDGDASFIAAPTPGLASFRFGASEVSSPSLYQDRNEILNRIVIEGDKVAELVGWEENMPSELKDEASDATSITAYGEHTLSIKNHLFQDLTSITAMCATLLAAYKDPKWYSRFNAPYSGVPLELYDSAGMMEMLDVSLVAGKFVYHGGIIRSIDISKYNTTYKIEVENIFGQCMIVAACGDIADKYENASDADKSYAYVASCATMVFADGTPAMRVCKCS